MRKKRKAEILRVKRRKVASDLGEVDDVWVYIECPLFKDVYYIDSKETINTKEEENRYSFITILDKWISGWHTLF